MRGELTTSYRFGILHKSMNVLLGIDSTVAEDMRGIADGYTVRMAVLASPIVAVFQYTKGRIYAYRHAKQPATVDLDIVVKSTEHLLRIVRGKTGFMQAFNRNEIVVNGKMSDCVAFIRCADKAMAYSLLHRNYVRNYGCSPERVISMLNMRLRILFIRRLVK